MPWKDVDVVILLTGASGFIGQRLAAALRAAHHRVICAVRDPGHPSTSGQAVIKVDFTRDLTPADWLPHLQGVEVVINAVGILREHGSHTFDLLHTRAPCALFAACVDAGVGQVIQISALGADAQATSGYHLSKKAADDFLAGLPVASVIVQPSLVYGPGGTSAQLFTMLASLPVLPLPGSGQQRVQPVHIDDLISLVARVVEQPRQRVATCTRVAVVGPEPMTLALFLATLRQSMGLGKATTIPVPMPLVRLAARLGALVPGTLLDADTLAMLERGNTADAGPVAALLGRLPRAVTTFITPAEAPALRLQAKLQWLLPVLRVSIALVWIVTGIVSLGLYPVADSYALLARTGVTGALAPVMLYGAALLDLLIGVAILALPRRRWLWMGQLVLIGVYTVIISVRLPEFWLHPYGPLLKNLPMLAAIGLLLALDGDRDGATSSRIT